jgi:hypothetical protein
VKEEPAITVETSEGFHAPFRARQYFGRQWVQYEGFYSGHLLFSGVAMIPIYPSAMSGSGTFQTSSDVRLESGFGGKAEDMGSHRVFRLLTQMRHSVIGGGLIAWRAGDVASRD